MELNPAVALPPTASAAYKSALTPGDPLGARYVHWFGHGWNTIVAPMPEKGQKPEWITPSLKYEVALRSMWNRHQSLNSLIGISMPTFTNYVMFDIDILSRIHLDNNAEQFEQFLQALEKIGLVYPVVVQSSWSGGLHVYYFFSEEVGTFGAACAIKGTLLAAKFGVRGGQLECFPNCKPYGFKEITNYNPHRAPMQPQSGSHYIRLGRVSDRDDWDPKKKVEYAFGMIFGRDSDSPEEYRHELEIFLNEADNSAAANNLKLFREAMTEQYKHRGKLVDGKGMSAAAFEWKLDLERITDEGWTAHGQTNELLKLMSVYGVVFLGLEGEDLVTHVYETAIASPGYSKWCRHQHEIEKRVRAWATAVQKDGYYLKYRGFPKRQRKYYEQFGIVFENDTGQNNIVRRSGPNAGSTAQASQAQERIRVTVATLKATGIYPDTIEGRVKAITAVGISRQTLYKPDNQLLWHPKYDWLIDPWDSPLPPTTPSIPIAVQLCLPPAPTRLCLPPAPTRLRLPPALEPLPGAPYTSNPKNDTCSEFPKPLLGAPYTSEIPNEGLRRDSSGAEAPQGVGSTELCESGDAPSFQPHTPGGGNESVPEVALGQTVIVRGLGQGTVERLTETGDMLIRFATGMVKLIIAWAIAYEQGVIGFPVGDNAADTLDAEMKAKAEATRLAMLKGSISVRRMQWRTQPKSRSDIEKWAQSTPGVKMTADGPVLDEAVLGSVAQPISSDPPPTPPPQPPTPPITPSTPFKVGDKVQSKKSGKIYTVSGYTSYGHLLTEEHPMPVPLSAVVSVSPKDSTSSTATSQKSTTVSAPAPKPETLGTTSPSTPSTPSTPVSDIKINGLKVGKLAISTNTGEKMTVLGFFEENGLQFASIKYVSDGVVGQSRITALMPVDDEESQPDDKPGGGNDPEKPPGGGNNPTGGDDSTGGANVSNEEPLIPAGTRVNIDDVDSRYYAEEGIVTNDIHPRDSEACIRLDNGQFVAIAVNKLVPVNSTAIVEERPKPTEPHPFTVGSCVRVQGSDKVVIVEAIDWVMGKPVVQVSGSNHLLDASLVTFAPVEPTKPTAAQALPSPG